MPSRKPGIDMTPRNCTVCKKSFRVTDYPTGAFEHKYFVRPGNHVGTCPECEANILENTLESARTSTIKPTTLKDQRKHEKFLTTLAEDIELLKTGAIATERHARNALKVYGDYMTPEQEREIRRLILNLP